MNFQNFYATTSQARNHTTAKAYVPDRKNSFPKDFQSFSFRTC